MWYIWHCALTSAYRPPLTRPSHWKEEVGSLDIRVLECVSNDMCGSRQYLLMSYMGKSMPACPKLEGNPKLLTSCLPWLCWVRISFCDCFCFSVLTGFGWGWGLGWGLGLLIGAGWCWGNLS